MVIPLQNQNTETNEMCAKQFTGLVYLKEHLAQKRATIPQHHQEYDQRLDHEVHDDSSEIPENKGIVVSQRNYILDLLKEIGMKGCKPSNTLIEANFKLGEVKNDVQVNKGTYQRLVERLIYLSHTRLDIAFVVSMVRQFMHSPYEEHLENVYQILRYLKSTLGKGLFFQEK